MLDQKEKKSILDGIIPDMLLRYPRFWLPKIKDMPSIIEGLIDEMEALDSDARAGIHISKEDAMRIKAVWVVSGTGTYFEPITTTSGDQIYKDKPWAYFTDKKRIDHGVAVVLAITKEKLGSAADDNIRRHISKSGPFLVYNGIPLQNEALESMTMKESFQLPPDKLFIAPGKVARTLDQVKQISFPKDCQFKVNDLIGVVTHVHHYTRVIRMVNRFRPLPDGVSIRPFLLPIPEEGRAYSMQAEIRGILAYSAEGAATLENYPIEKNPKQSIEILPVDKSDMLSVFNLSNEPDVRAVSFNNDEIKLEDHKKWFAKKIADKDAIFLKAEVDGKFAGQIRYEIEGNEALVGISVSKDFRGMGIGSILLSKGAKYIAENRPEVTLIRAYIKISNQASVHLFEKNGFKLNKKETIDGNEAFLYLLEITV
ncbi:MAG: GNAT family N-acetyltransferase [Patescibacteria group bacterium]